jgi:hypothetical protein
MSPFAPRKDAPVRGTKDDQPIITAWITTQAAAKVQCFHPALLDLLPCAVARARPVAR